MFPVTSLIMEINFDNNVLVSGFCLVNFDLVYVLRYEEVLPENLG